MPSRTVAAACAALAAAAVAATAAPTTSTVAGRTAVLAQHTSHADAFASPADQTRKVTGTGDTYFADPAPAAAPGAPALDLTQLSVTARIATPANVFALHSRPSATRKVYLDFNGMRVAKTIWNRIGVPAGAVRGFSIDADASTYTDAERTAIYQIWAQVAEDYSPFDVDVTTANPGTQGIRRAGRRDQRYGTIVLISSDVSLSASVCPDCGGMTQLGSFGRVASKRKPLYLQPALVFADRLYNATPWVAGATAHEIGHALGLSHDGAPGYEYYQGNTVWSPIMGEDYTPLTQFDNGTYPGANNHENDYAVIARRLPLLGDDVGNTPATATILPGGSAATSGRIGPGDRDVYALNTGCLAPIQVDAGTSSIGPDLNVGLTVTNAAGAVVAQAAKNVTVTGGGFSRTAVGLDAHLTTLPLPAGRYYVTVTGVGQAGANAFSGYGSVGPYSLWVNSCPGVNPPTAPAINAARSGARGGKNTALVRWSAPASDGGAAVTGYQVLAQKVAPNSHLVAAGTYTVAPTAHTVQLRLHPGKYRFSVRAVNAAGPGPWSRTSNAATAR